MHETTERLYLAARLLKKTEGQSAVARLLNISPQVMKNWESRGVSRQGMIDAQRLVGCRSTWVETGSGEMEDTEAPASQLINLSANPDLKEVPRVRFKLSAGVSGYAIEVEEGNGKPVFFREDWFKMNGYRPEKLFAVRISGASMEPALWESDLVVINTEDTTPVDGDAFAINYEGELCIKRLRRDAGEWWATSDNADQRRFSPKRCTEDVKVIGRVVYKQSERI